MVEILRAGLEHSAILCELGSKTFAETFIGMNYYTEEIVAGYTQDAFSDKKIREELADPKVTYFLLQANGLCIGYAKLVDREPPNSVVLPSAIYLQRIYLLKSAQGKGFGEALMHEVYREARKHQCKNLWLSVWEYNERAVKFYLKAGFEKIGEWEWIFESQGKRYVDIDWVFAREIPALA